ncbi:MAG TPA: DUF484 family protein [Burkholderiales bacterium]|nr:DUF484 family protein [Burkholderiales bacterium]
MSEIEGLDADAVARYLQQHPSFFERFGDLLNSVQIPSPHGGRAIALADRQVQSLREKNRALESKLGELIRFGEENDTISDRVHGLALDLIAAENKAQVLHVLYEQLSLRLQVPYVAFRLWHGEGDGPEFEPVSAELRDFAAGLERPYCGANENFEAVSWLGDAAQVGSVAFIALRDSAHCFGMMALGSEDSHRFYPDMGTLYLERIGEMASTALLRIL